MISGSPLSAVPLASAAPALPDVAASLSWKLRSLDRVMLRQRRATTSQNPLLMNISPIPQPAPPTELTWQPQFPTHPQRHRARRFAPVIFPVQPPIINLTWLPILTTHPQRRPPPHPPQVIMGDIGAQPAIAKFPTWRTMWTAPIRRRAQRLQEGVYRTDMTTLLNAAPCIELTAEVLTSPLLTPETAVSPAMDEETLTTPLLSEEDLC